MPAATALNFDGFNDDQMRALMVLMQQHMEQRKVSFDDQVSSVQQQRYDERMKEIGQNVAVIETTNAAFEVCLNEILGDIDESRWIVSQLDKCRRMNDFRHFIPVYFKYRGKDLKIEELLRTLAAIYRLKMKNYNNPADKSKDRAIVRHEIRCPHCGEYATRLVEYLEIKGIRWAD
jgi:hypothetical protein